MTPTNIQLTHSHDAPDLYRARIGDGETFRNYEIHAADYIDAQIEALKLWAADDEREPADAE